MPQLNVESLIPPFKLRPAIAMTDEELMRFSENNKPYRIERNKEGEITIMTPVGGIGSTNERYVMGELLKWTEKDATGIDFSPSIGFNLPDGSCLSPDASWIALSRWNVLTPEQQAGFPPLCPDFLVEVRSRTDPRRLVEAKMQLWIENGAKLAWLVDPIDHKVTIYQPGTEPRTLDRPDIVVATSPVTGFKLVCGPLWSSS